MEQIKPIVVKKTTNKRAYILLLYIVAITVAVVWLGVKVIITPTPVCESTPVTVEETNATTASWYDYDLNGIPWSLDHRTAASREFARGTLVEVTNTKNGKSVEVLINDYGPDESVHPDRELDLSSYAFKQIADLQNGLVEVEYRAIGQGEYRPIVSR